MHRALAPRSLRRLYPGSMSLGGWLQDQLFERRIVLLTGTLDDDAAATTAAALIVLDTRADQPIIGLGEMRMDAAP